jgi:hypothetical protein
MCLAVGVLVLSCASARLYYVQSELPLLEGDSNLMVGRGPWPIVPTVLSDAATVPDELVLPMLRALMDLPGAADACDASGQPRADAAEYCVATYKTPQDWRVSWPIRKSAGEKSACKPPFGGVDDEDFGRGLPVFGYAHNHPCGLFASSKDLMTFPVARTPEGTWVMVGYGITPGGELARDAQGQVMPAWGWLATGHADDPRFYKWSPTGEVFKWSEEKKQWEFQATCKPQVSKMFYPDQALPPSCSP